MGRLQSDLGHGYRIQSAPDTSASSRNDERPKLRMEKSTPANVKVYLDRGTNLPLTRREQQKSKTSTEESEMIHTANDAADLLAKEYRAAFSNRPITIPDYRTTQYRSEHDHPPTPLSARITDVVDHSLMPSPLRISQISRSERPSSHFSSSSSNADSIHDGIRGSFRAYARKVLNVPKASAEDTEKKRIMSVASAKYPHMNLDLTKRSRLSSVASQGSASIQQGLSNMYDTLTSLSVGSSKAKPTIDIASTKRKDIVRERRSPAIPVTPYQHLGRKAWETPKSPKQKSPKKIFPFLPRSRSNATRFGRPTGQDPLRRTNSERRREELKKKIVVIGATDPYSVGRVSHWL
ncbi:hypothetical protein MMC20_005984 [Loxospora ochrophaea]|nr:hypothetical protein [Loxospora ochrophaea]